MEIFHHKLCKYSANETSILWKRSSFSSQQRLLLRDWINRRFPSCQFRLCFKANSCAKSCVEFVWRKEIWFMLINAAQLVHELGNSIFILPCFFLRSRIPAGAQALWLYCRKDSLPREWILVVHQRFPPVLWKSWADVASVAPYPSPFCRQLPDFRRK